VLLSVEIKAFPRALDLATKNSGGKGVQVFFQKNTAPRRFEALAEMRSVSDEQLFVGRYLLKIRCWKE